MHIPKKHLGQNFLTDEFIASEIVRVADINDQLPLLEIGPGLGAITKIMLESSNVKITAVEKDPELVKRLNKLVSAYHERLKVICSDALFIDETAVLNAPLQIVANLPYNIATELLFKWLDKISCFSSITIMLQAEVAKRIVAQPHSSSYGWLSVITQLLCETAIVLKVPPQAFWPQPKVNSAVLKLTPRAALLYECDINKVKTLCKLLFTHRRKMISNTLKNTKLLDIMQGMGIPLSARAEELTIETLCALSQHLN